MGTLIGHVAPGFGFVLIGLWHLFNHIKLFSKRPGAYHGPPWFPAPWLRHLELYLIIAGSTASILMELVIGPEKHEPFDDDGTIPSNHLHNFEHATISLTFLTYAAFAILFDRTKPRAGEGLLQLLAAAAFSQQLLFFHLHSADHMGVEGEYHWLLQLVIAVTLSTTLLAIPFPKSFLISFVRSFSIAFQGFWFVAMGFMLWTPSLVPKGCYLNLEVGHQVMRCHGEEALDRAKSLVNLSFGWYLEASVLLAMGFYCFLTKMFPEKVEYQSLDVVKEEEEEEEQDLESQNKMGQSMSFVHIGRGLSPIELER